MWAAIRAFQWLVVIAALLAGVPKAGAADQFDVDCAAAEGPALSKDLIGVYQTPFWFTSHPPGQTDLTALLREAGVRHLRYELAWGKPDAFASGVVAGPARLPTIDFRPLDPFLAQLDRAHVSPLLVLGYCPAPLQNSPAAWQRWKDAPTDRQAWAAVCRQYAAHCETAFGFPQLSFEVWNEPDLPGDGGKVFYNGNAADYGELFTATAMGVRAAGGTASVGGPAYAYDTAYLTQSDLIARSPDFVSLHAYGNAAAQLAGLRSVLNRRSPPIEFTEYGSYRSDDPRFTTGGHAAAAAFFSDVAYFLQQRDVRRVYWAQWVDDDLGLLSSDLHRRALFNAYSLYQTRLPVERCRAEPAAVKALHVLAGANSSSVGVVVWNDGDIDASPTVRVRHVPGNGNRAVGVLRIDAHHGSFKDDPSAERLAVSERVPVGDADTAAWSGVIPARSVVFLELGEARH